MSLGVRVSTTNPLLAEQFRLAMDFWAQVLDLDWHEENTQDCSMQVVDGDRNLFEPEPFNVVARSQFPDRLGFQGWIVFNPGVRLNKQELYRISVHEIGHVFGLRHNSSTGSLMYGLDLDGSESLDSADLTSLAAHHKLRVASFTQSVKLIQPR